VLSFDTVVFFGIKRGMKQIVACLCGIGRWPCKIGLVFMVFFDLVKNTETLIGSLLIFTCLVSFFGWQFLEGKLCSATSCADY